MTFDQIFPIVTFVVGAAVGLTGIMVTTHSARRDREAARAMASDERRQQRLETTYQELITYVARQREQFNGVRPLLTFPGQPPPQAIPLTDVYRARAVTIAHASTQVWELLDEFENACRSIASADVALSGIEETERQTRRPVSAEVFGGTSADFHKRLFADQQRLGEIEKRIHEQIRSELGAGQRTEGSSRISRDA